MELFFTENIEAQLKLIANDSSAKQWRLKVKCKDHTVSFKNKIQELLSKRKDNSLYVYNKYGKLDDLPQISQNFNICPPSFY